MFLFARGDFIVFGATYGSQCCWCCLWFLVLLVLPMVLDAVSKYALFIYRIWLIFVFRRSSVLYIAYFSQIHWVTIEICGIFVSLSLLFYNVKSVRLIHVFPDQHLSVKLNFLVFFRWWKRWSSYACVC